MASQRPLAAVLLACCACATSGFEEARVADTPEAYRAFLREQPQDPSAPAARDRLAELEFQQARRQNTILAYKRFLADFPDSSRRSDAQVLLEGLRFEAAREKGTSTAWNEFLRDHSAGAHAAEAKAGLEAADFAEASAAGTSQAFEDFLARHPDGPHRAQAERAADDALFAEAKAAGLRALVGYLDRKPSGAHREEARALLSAEEAGARVALGDFAGAYRIAQAAEDEAARARAVAEVERAELEWVSAELDPAALEQFAVRRGGEAAGLARERARALTSDRKNAKALAELALRLDPGRAARSEEVLVAALAASDPRERWLAAQELGETGSWDAIDPLLEAAANSRFSKVRSRAFEALQALFRLMPRASLELAVRERAEAIRKMAQGPALQVKLSILEELLGDRKAAADDYARALRGDNADLFALRRLVALRGERREGFGTALAARDLATRVRDLVEQRAREEGLSPLLLARTLCGAREDAAAALAALRGLPPELAKDFPEDLPAFVQRAEEAERLASARLADAEAQARLSDPDFERCGDEGDVAQRIAEGVKDRLQAVEALAARSDPKARPALARAGRRDPSPAVRAAAQAALEKLDGRTADARVDGQ